MACLMFSLPCDLLQLKKEFKIVWLPGNVFACKIAYSMTIQVAAHV
jgi:hypothetical protein